MNEGDERPQRHIPIQTIVNNGYYQAWVIYKGKCFFSEYDTTTLGALQSLLEVTQKALWELMKMEYELPEEAEVSENWYRKTGWRKPGYGVGVFGNQSAS